MSLFQQSHTFDAIKRHLEKHEIMHDTAVFECYADGVATFVVRKGKKSYFIDLISDAPFLRLMEVEELFRYSENVSFFEYREVENVPRQPDVLHRQLTWRKD